MYHAIEKTRNFVKIKYKLIYYLSIHSIIHPYISVIDIQYRLKDITKSLMYSNGTF